MKKTEASNHDWSFQKLGGVYQVVLTNGDDINALPELDPKLWVALACPTGGSKVDGRLLTAIDNDRDGRIRLPEVVEILEWFRPKIKDCAAIITPVENMPLSIINDESLISTAKVILERAGREDAETLNLDDVEEAMLHASEQLINGDGIILPDDRHEQKLNSFIQAALDTTGGVMDASGKPGVNKDIVLLFTENLKKYKAWEKIVSETQTPYGANVQEAWALYNKLKNKINDYFLRCEFIVFAPLSHASLNVYEKLKSSEEASFLQPEFLAELPLSRVEGDVPLNMLSGINPVWSADVKRLADLVAPVLAQPGVLSRDDWDAVQKGFSSYAAALATKPEMDTIVVDVAPVSSIDALDGTLVDSFLSGTVVERFCKLSDDDKTTPASLPNIAEVRRLVLCYKYLYRFLMNFASFTDFFDTKRRAAFTLGTLYIDGRACNLCLPVDNTDKHSEIASLSNLYLLYCVCTRVRKPETDEPEGTFNIVAAVTNGDSDLLHVGRNGIYIDCDGNDWDAIVVKIVSNPINVYQAALSPYKKIRDMAHEQIVKLTSQKQATILDKSSKTIQGVLSAPAAEQPQKFDIGRNVGILAAVGLAIGAIGTAFASILRAVFSLTWWQLPLVILGLFLLISGPSVILAWYKIRKRTVSPLLEASGWAINSKVLIRYRLGSFLTRKAQLPANASKTNNADYDRKRNKGPIVVIIAMLIGVALILGWIKFKPNIIETFGDAKMRLEQIQE